MVQIIAVANKVDNCCNPISADAYFLSQGKTVKSAEKNLFSELKKSMVNYSVEVFKLGEKSDVMPIIYRQFSRWADGERWNDIFPDLCLPRPHRSSVMEIEKKLYDKTVSFAKENGICAIWGY